MKNRWKYEKGHTMWEKDIQRTSQSSNFGQIKHILDHWAFWIIFHQILELNIELNIFDLLLNEFFDWMYTSEFILNWILNWIIFGPDSTFDWIIKTYRTGLLLEDLWVCFLAGFVEVISYIFRGRKCGYFGLKGLKGMPTERDCRTYNVVSCWLEGEADDAGG